MKVQRQSPSNYLVNGNLSEIRDEDYNLDFKTVGGIKMPNKPFTPGRSVSPGSGFTITNPPPNKNTDSP